MAQEVALWIAREGPARGIRFPNDGERARAAGVGEYVPQLGLQGVEAYSALGNHFDGYIITLGAGQLVQRLL